MIMRRRGKRRRKIRRRKIRRRWRKVRRGKRRYMVFTMIVRFFTCPKTF
tara:strand:- start:1199 stop:1345 length:147 start_codon:yes stop_codon:yes gene_type:complete